MSERLLEMLTVWLRCTNPLPTWNILIEALESPPVGERLLAQQLRDKYCPGHLLPGAQTLPTSQVLSFPGNQALPTLQEQSISGAPTSSSTTQQAQTIPDALAFSLLGG